MLARTRGIQVRGFARKSFMPRTGGVRVQGDYGATARRVGLCLREEAGQRSGVSRAGT